MTQDNVQPVADADNKQEALQRLSEMFEQEMSHIEDEVDEMLGSYKDALEERVMDNIRQDLHENA